MRWLLLALLALLWVPGVARANISAPWGPGDPGAEPGGDLGQLEVLDERLDIDLRPLAGGASGVPVRVVYDVRNRGPALQRRLIFVTPGIARGAVRLDGDLLAQAEARGERLPEAWRQAHTPGIEGGSLPYEVPEEARVLAFPVAFAAGARHRIEVTYELQPGWSDTDDIYISHQIAYLLAPARQWGGFGSLHVRVQVPAGWQAAAVPALGRQGDVLAGRFDGVPADFLGVTVRRPPAYRWGWLLPVAALAAGLVLGLALIRRLGRRAGGWGRGVALLAGAGTSLLTALALLGLAAGGLAVWQGLLDQTQTSGRYFYGAGMLLIVLGPVLALAYVVVALVLFFRARGRSRRGAGGTPGPAA